MRRFIAISRILVVKKIDLKFDKQNLIEMLIETRKIHLIEEVLKLQSDDVLSKLESVLEKSKPKKKKKPDARNFVGLISDEDAKLMMKAIDEDCGQIDLDGWK